MLMCVSGLGEVDDIIYLYYTCGQYSKMHMSSFMFLFSRPVNFLQLIPSWSYFLLAFLLQAAAVSSKPAVPSVHPLHSIINS